jgi:hypothetical protein
MHRLEFFPRATRAPSEKGRLDKHAILHDSIEDAHGEKMTEKVLWARVMRRLSAESHLRASQPEISDFLTHRDSPRNSFVFPRAGMVVYTRGPARQYSGPNVTKMTAEGLLIRDEKPGGSAGGLLFI